MTNERLHDLDTVLTYEEIEELRNICYEHSNSWCPISDFFNDIERTKNTNYNKNQAFKDLWLIVNIILEKEKELKEKQNKTLYVVTRGEYSDYRVECIFEDKEKAENYVKYHQNSWEDCRIEEYNLEDKKYKLITNGYYEISGEIVIDKTGLIKDLKTWNKGYLTNTPETESSLSDYDWSDNSSGNWKLYITRSFPESSIQYEGEPTEKLIHILKDTAVQVASLRVQGFDIDYVEQMLKMKEE